MDAKDVTMHRFHRPMCAALVLWANAALVSPQTTASPPIPFTAPLFDDGDATSDPLTLVATIVDGDQIVQPPAGPPPTPRHTGIKAMIKGVGVDVTHLPSRTNLYWTIAGSGLAAVAHPFDDDVHDAVVGSTRAENIFKPGAVLGSLPVLLGSAVTIYAVGRIDDQPKVSHVGMDLIRSLALSEGVTMALKYTTRRERPDNSSKTSFPSGHSADTFAFATALERHLGWRGAVPAYIFSSYVALSRMPANRHWLSDVVFGSTVGIIAGRTVTRHGRENYPVALAVVPGGAAVMFVRSSHADN
jgi:membrane-associated phospholipid phosphatase